MAKTQWAVGKSQSTKAHVPRSSTPDCRAAAERPSPTAQLNAQDQVRKAEEHFRGAIAIARAQHAKSLELRATMSLVRLLQQEEKYSEAHRLLSAIYNWFTEGFDTKDLQEAKSLLDELAAHSSALRGE